MKPKSTDSQEQKLKCLQGFCIKFADTGNYCKEHIYLSQPTDNNQREKIAHVNPNCKDATR